MILLWGPLAVLIGLVEWWTLGMYERAIIESRPIRASVSCLILVCVWAIATKAVLEGELLIVLLYALGCCLGSFFAASKKFRHSPSGGNK